jgi:hypothetical protein
MYSVILTLQLFLLLPALPLALLSHRTSRAHRSRHSSFLAVASLIGLLAVVFGFVGLSVAVSGHEEQDWLLSFGPPVITIAACAFVIRRALSPVQRRSRPASARQSGYASGYTSGYASGYSSEMPAEPSVLPSVQPTDASLDASPDASPDASIDVSADVSADESADESADLPPNESPDTPVQPHGRTQPAPQAD